jgi:hypothetical protein
MMTMVSTAAARPLPSKRVPITASHIRAVDASKPTDKQGRYETVSKTKSGEVVNVRRSCRHARKDNLSLQATITPKKEKPAAEPPSVDIDGLCYLFQSKLCFSPEMTPRSNRLSSAAAMSAILAEE